MQNTISSPQRFFLYARKSTDVEDKQVRSIEDQITELRAFARQEGLHIVEELVEKQSAKIPGRPIFGEMIKRVESGEANGILAWHPDRLARNSVDGGRIIYLLDCGHLAILKFPTFWAENTSQGKFMLSIAFGQSKYYVDSLAENTKRGLRQKVRRGEYPSLAPIGYINDVRTKTIIVDKKKSVIIRRAFELYAQNGSRLEDISNFLAQNNIFSSGGKRIKRDRISFILSNPFYYGHFRYASEIHEGKHQPLVSKKIFDRVQEIMREKGKPQKVKKHNFDFLGLMKCPCSAAITAEKKIKPSGREYVYYRCTKKKGPCQEKHFLRQEELYGQIKSFLQKVSLSSHDTERVLAELGKEEIQAKEQAKATVQNLKTQLGEVEQKLEKLLDVYLEETITAEEYASRKEKLLMFTHLLSAFAPSALSWEHENTSSSQPRPLPKGDGSAQIASSALFQETVV